MCHGDAGCPMAVLGVPCRCQVTHGDVSCPTAVPAVPGLSRLSRGGAGCPHGSPPPIPVLAGPPPHHPFRSPVCPQRCVSSSPRRGPHACPRPSPRVCPPPRPPGGAVTPGGAGPSAGRRGSVPGSGRHRERGILGTASRDWGEAGGGGTRYRGAGGADTGEEGSVPGCGARILAKRWVYWAGTGELESW